MVTAQEIIAHLNLQPLDREGGYFVETYRSPGKIPTKALGGKYHSDRAFGTAIYYLLTPDTFSAIHSLPADEIFHFYLGDPVEMLQLRPDGSGERIIIGPALESGMQPQVLVQAGVWQGSRLMPGGQFALLGTTMTPGFEFEDYTPGLRQNLIEQYPKFKELITALTRE